MIFLLAEVVLAWSVAATIPRIHWIQECRPGNSLEE
jgi:hypothetical protein